MNEKLIEGKLKNTYNNYVSKYGENHILGTFLVGIGNYGFAETEDELQFLTIYIPTFEQLCFNNQDMKNEEDIIDIRQLYKMYEITPLELLYSNHYIITDKYMEFYIKCLENKKLLCNYKHNYRLKISYFKVHDAFHRGDLFEGVRLAIAMRLYAAGADCEKCFHISDPVYKNYLWSCKHKEIDVDTDEILSEIYELFDENEEDSNFNASKFLKDIVIEVIARSLQESVSMDAFEECLTATEKKAWDVLKKIMHEGTNSFSISKLIEETGFSRPVFKNLLQKLKDNNIAKVENQGVKGTYIELL